MCLKTTKVYLLRHGLPEGDDCLRGHTDLAITEQGQKQMFAATEHLKLDVVISSPLKRCLTFSHSYAQQHNLPVDTDNRFSEMDFGLWDGKPFDVLFSKYYDDVMAFFENPYKSPPPKGENMKAFNARVQSAFIELCKKRCNQNILLVTHGGVMREIMHLALGLEKGDPRLHKMIKLSYASMIKMEVIEDNNLLYYNINM